MTQQILLAALFLILYLFLLTSMELLYKRLGWKGEITRKMAHSIACLTVISFPFLFDHHLYVLVLAGIFFLLLFFSRWTTRLDSINDITRRSMGSFLLPAAIYISFLITWLTGQPLLYVSAMAVLAISDPLAGLVGSQLKLPNRQIVLFGHTLDKTWMGSSAFFVSCFLICLLSILLFWKGGQMHPLIIALLTALAVTMVEMLSTRGTDNLSVPLSVLLMLYLLT